MKSSAEALGRGSATVNSSCWTRINRVFDPSSPNNNPNRTSLARWSSASPASDRWAAVNRSVPLTGASAAR